jgi:hypothetical protein
MRKGDDAATVRQFETLAPYDRVALFMTDQKGEVTYSNRKNALRAHIADLIPPGAFRTALDLGLTRPIDHSALVHIDDKPYFAEIKTVQNAPSCHHCHGASRPILVPWSAPGRQQRMTAWPVSISRAPSFCFWGWPPCWPLCCTTSSGSSSPGWRPSPERPRCHRRQPGRALHVGGNDEITRGPSI